jgi:hypothetical protein
LLHDWSRLADGRVFGQVPALHFDTNWSNLRDGADAYVNAIAYSLRVISEYVTEFDLGNSLVIVLGDHQPVADMTGGSASTAVPIHIISRQSNLVDVFRRRGFQNGMQPAPAGGDYGMESFLPALLTDFSLACRPAPPSKK